MPSRKKKKTPSPVIQKCPIETSHDVSRERRGQPLIDSGHLPREDLHVQVTAHKNIGKQVTDGHVAPHGRMDVIRCIPAACEQLADIETLGPVPSAFFN